MNKKRVTLTIKKLKRLKVVEEMAAGRMTASQATEALGRCGWANSLPPSIRLLPRPFNHHQRLPPGHVLVRQLGLPLTIRGGAHTNKVRATLRSKGDGFIDPLR